jgi:hypothetical protein
MNGRFDLPIYQSGTDLFQNFISNFKGNAIFRSGLESYLQFQDCAFTEFRFSNTQNYIVVMYANKMRFLSYDVNGTFGWVLDAGLNILEVATPYTLAESKYICRGKPAQNQDVMIFTHFNYEPYKLTRVAANNFTFQTYARKDDPFPKTFTAPVAITAITQAANAVVTAAGHGYTTGDRIRLSGIGGMTQMNLWFARVTVLNANQYSIDVDSTTFTAYTGGGAGEKVLTGDWPDNALFYKARLWYSTTPLKTTTIWGSQSANYFIMTIPTGTTTATDALQFTIADITQRIEWLFGGDNSLIAGSADGMVAVNGGAVNEAITASTVEASITSADGCSRTYPFRKDGLIFYVGLNNRNVYYFSYDLLSESFKAKDANFISYDITIGGFSKLRYKKDRNDLIYSLRNNTDLCTLNFKESENIIGWHEFISQGTISDIAQITDNTGAPQIFALVQRNGNFYIEHQADYVEFAQRVSFLSAFTEAAKKVDDEAYNRYLGEQLRDCVYLDGSLSLTSLKTTTITYDPNAGTITSTGTEFSLSSVGRHIAYKSITGYDSGRFQITGYNGPNSVNVSVLQTPTSNTSSMWYLSFRSVSGLGQFVGKTVGVVTDGGYLADFFVSSSTMNFDQEVTSLVIGYRYLGIIKSFCLGFMGNGLNTQTNYKNITQASIRCVASAGIQFGSSLYHLQDLQELSQNDLNYLPPLPIDGTKPVIYSDDSEIDKYFYVVQPFPLPACVTSVMLEAEYAQSS